MVMEKNYTVWKLLKVYIIFSLLIISGSANAQSPCKGDDLYVFVLTHPGMYLFLDDELINFKKDTEIIWLQTKEKVKWRKSHMGDGVGLKLPLRQNTDPSNPLNAAHVFKIVGGAKK